MQQNIFQKIVLATMIFAALTLIMLPVSKTMALEADDYWGGTEQRQYVDQNSGLAGGETARDPRLVVVDVIKTILGFLGVIALVIILYAGFRWMTAGGNEENVSTAKKILISALIGLVIILSSYALATFVLDQMVKAISGNS